MPPWEHKKNSESKLQCHIMWIPSVSCHILEGAFAGYIDRVPKEFPKSSRIQTCIDVIEYYRISSYIIFRSHFIATYPAECLAKHWGLATMHCLLQCCPQLPAAFMLCAGAEDLTCDCRHLIDCRWTMTSGLMDTWNQHTTNRYFFVMKEQTMSANFFHDGTWHSVDYLKLLAGWHTHTQIFNASKYPSLREMLIPSLLINLLA